MGLLGIAKTVGKSLKGAADSGGEAPAAKPAGESAFSRISKWSEQRKVSKSLGANDLSGVTAKLDTGEVEAKKGGKVKSEGLIKVHEGERILTKAQTKKYDEGPKPAKKAAPKKKTASKAGPRKRS